MKKRVHDAFLVAASKPVFNPLSLVKSIFSMTRRILLACALITGCTQQQENVLSDTDLKIGQPSEVRSLKAHAADTFKLSLAKGAFVFGNADQISMDVIVQIFDPAGNVIREFDGPARGPENFDFETTEAGIHKVVVTPFEENSGDYKLTLEGAEPIATDLDRRVEQLVKASVGSFEGPGAAIAIERDGKIVYSKGFGHADLEHDVHITPATVFHIASVSKQFTAFAIAMLADQGKLSVDDDIRKYLPEMHDFGTPITINHLVHHTSGLRDQWNLLMIAGWRLDDVITTEQIINMMSKQRELNFKPGDEMLYCNSGFTLMAEIVKRVTGQSFPDWSHENIFQPLGMNSTLFYDDHERIVYNRAYSYRRDSDGFKKSNLNYANAGATSLFTTVEDLSKWAANFETPRVGNERVMAMMNERFVLNNGDTIDYAYGQGIGKYKGLDIISHGGADAGYRTFFVRFPEQRVSISVFSNLAQFNPGGLSFAVADVYLADQLKPEPPSAQAPPPAQTVASTEEKKFDPTTVNLADFVGRYYSDEVETAYTFNVVNDTLRAQHQRHPDRKLAPRKENEFSAPFLGTIAFTRGKDGKVNGMKVSNGRVRNLWFERVK